MTETTVYRCKETCKMRYKGLGTVRITLFTLEQTFNTQIRPSSNHQIIMMTGPNKHFFRNLTTLMCIYKVIHNVHSLNHTCSNLNRCTSSLIRCTSSPCPLFTLLLSTFTNRQQCNHPTKIHTSNSRALLQSESTPLL